MNLSKCDLTGFIIGILYELFWYTPPKFNYTPFYTTFMFYQIEYLVYFKNSLDERKNEFFRFTSKTVLNTWSEEIHIYIYENTVYLFV